MSSLADHVRVTRRFQRSIRVDTDVGDVAALEGFICPPSAAHGLLSMARQVADTGHGAFTWTGPYGSGKSSLAVAFVSLLGPAGALRARAREVLGPQVADQLLALLPPGEEGWTILPIVGRRADPAAVIAEAIDERRRGRRRTNGRGRDLLAKLCATAAEAPGAGLVLIIDEMGKFLEQATFGDADVYLFQELAEAAARSGRRLLVIGLLHQAFDDYANRLAREVRDEWLKIQGRFIDVPINVAGEEQIALIARAIEAATPPPTAPDMAGIVKAIQHRRPGTAPELEHELAACWPLHPVVACLLGPLSRRRFGQNQRSVFGFLNSAEPFGFQEFLRTTPTGSGQTYGPPLLWDYLRANLEPSILASPDGHRWSLAVDAVERCEARSGDFEHLDLVKTVALIDLFKERSGLAPSLDVLNHVLPNISADRLTAMIDQLCSWSVIIFKKHLGAYAIYAGSDFDIDAAVDQARARMTGIDFARLRGLAMLQPFVAKRHYHETGALRWFDIDIAPLGDGIEIAQAYRPRNGATGLFLLLIGTQGETDSKARRLWRQATEAAGAMPVAVGWSRDSFMIRELAGEFLALEAVRAERTELNGDAVARREVNARIARIGAELEERVRQAFVFADWMAATKDGLLSLPRHAGLAGLNSVASQLAADRYPWSPKLSNELLNRIKPSSNAIAAQKALLKAMVKGIGQPRLGIIGFPAEGGLFASLLERPGLYGPAPDQSGCHQFTAPSADNSARLAPLWESAEALFREAGPAGATLDTLYERWQEPPFGVRHGLLPVFAIAFLLSRVDRLAVYLDGTFQPRLTTLLVDRLTQDPTSVRFRWSVITDFHLEVLTGVAAAVAEQGGRPDRLGFPEPLDIARGLVGIITDLKPWTLKTTRLSGTAVKVRNLAKLASDPNKFLLDDIPATFGDDSGQVLAEARPVIQAVREGLSELVAAYPRMLRELEAVMFTELRIRTPNASDIAELHHRAETVKGLTGNYRLDAFATRLATYAGTEPEIEGIASLAANKPPRDWVDRDIDQARVEIAALGQAFIKAEGLAHVKGRADRRTAIAIYFSDPSRPAPVTPDFDISVGQQPEVDQLVSALLELLEQQNADRNVALAAIAELGTRLAELTSAPLATKARPIRRRRAS